MAELTEVVQAADAVTGAAIEAAPKVWPILAVGFGTGLVVGFTAGGWFVNRRLRLQYEKLAEDEISQMRDHFRNKVAAVQTREETKRPVEDLVREAGYVPDEPGAPNVAVPEPQRVTVTKEDFAVKPEEVEKLAEAKNVFDSVRTKSAYEGWDYEFELANRPEEDGIYIIHEDEQHEKPYNTTTLTYYEGDDILADHDDRIVENRQDIIGTAIGRWGHGSSDPSTVYVRNDRLGVDVELCLAKGSFSEEVHGIRHADETFQARRRRPEHDE